MCFKTYTKVKNLFVMKKLYYYLLSSVLLISLSTVALNLSFSTLNDGSNLSNDKVILVNAQKSTVKWKANKVTGSHEGLINIKTANLNFNNDVLIGGEVTIDMSSINCTDLSGPYKNKLEDHLNSGDFFNISDYPSSTLMIKECSKVNENKYSVIADLTIKNITETIEFEAELSNNIATAVLDIDRTKFDIKYGSGSFFENLGDKMIDDNFNLTVNINY